MGGGDAGGGCTRSGFIRGCAGSGSEPLPYLGKAGLRKYTLFYGKSHYRVHPMLSALRKKPHLRENLITLGTWSSPDSEIIPYFREVWWNYTRFRELKQAFKKTPCRAAHTRMAIGGSAPPPPPPPVMCQGTPTDWAILIIKFQDNWSVNHSLGPAKVARKIFDGVCGSGFPWKGKFSRNIPLAREHLLIMSQFSRDFKQF